MSSPERIKECMDQDGFPVRYAYSLPDEETLHRLIDFPNNVVPPYLFSVLLDFGEEKEVAFGDARRHQEIVNAITQERGRKIYYRDWLQLQIDFEKGSTKFNKITSVGLLSENDACLLLRGVCPQLFVPSRIPIIVATTSLSYIYDPGSGELQKVEQRVGGEEIESMGRIQTLPVLA